MAVKIFTIYYFAYSRRWPAKNGQTICSDLALVQKLDSTILVRLFGIKIKIMIIKYCDIMGIRSAYSSSNDIIIPHSIV